MPRKPNTATKDNAATYTKARIPEPRLTRSSSRRAKALAPNEIEGENTEETRKQTETKSNKRRRVEEDDTVLETLTNVSASKKRVKVTEKTYVDPFVLPPIIPEPPFTVAEHEAQSIALAMQDSPPDTNDPSDSRSLFQKFIEKHTSAIANESRNKQTSAPSNAPLSLPKEPASQTSDHHVPKLAKPQKKQTNRLTLPGTPARTNSPSSTALSSTEPPRLAFASRPPVSSCPASSTSVPSVTSTIAASVSTCNTSSPVPPSKPLPSNRMMADLVASLSNRIERLERREKAFEESEKKMKRAQENICALQEQVENLDGEVGELKHEIDEHTGSLALIRSAIEELKGPDMPVKVQDVAIKLEQSAKERDNAFNVSNHIPSLK